MKNPEPLRARSRLLPVEVGVPWPNSCATSATCTPLPTAVRETPSWVWAKRSENSARDSLKPVVLTFARLFDVTLRSVLAALMPERARSNDMGTGSSVHLDDVGERQRSGIGIQGKGLRARVDGHAVDRALQISGYGGRRAVAHRGCGEGVRAGRRSAARIGGAVPREAREPGGLRGDLESAHQLSRRVGYLDGDGAGAGRRSQRTGHLAAGGKRRRGSGGEHSVA